MTQHSAANGGVSIWATLAVAIITAVATWVLTRPTPTEPPSMQALSIVFPDDHTVIESALSPDGTRLVYAAIANGRVQLFLRPFDTFRAEPLPGTEDATQPFFAPDGERVGFFSSGFLRWVAFDGTGPVDVTSVSGETAGAAWGARGQIVFAPLGGQGLLTVSADSGRSEGDPTVTPITELDEEAGEVSHGWPIVLPDGGSIVFTVGREDLDPRLAWMVTESGERELLAPVDGSAYYLDSGHLVYARRGEIFALPVDSAEHEVTGPVRLVASGVAGSAVGYERLGRSRLVAARTGRLVYASELTSPTDNLMTWVDREGSTTNVDGVAAPHQAPRLSPDGSQIAMTIQGGAFSRDLWTYDVAAGERRRLTHEAGQNHSPLWSEDGRWITFASNRDGPQRIYRVAAGATNTVETLLFGDGRTPGSWSPADRDLFFHELQQARGRDIWVWTRRSGEGRVLLGTNANERTPAISPNGRWLVYVSDTEDGDQVYLRPHPGESDTRVSPAGGVEPVWSRDGSELFYRSGRDLFSVTIDAETGEASSPRRLFAGVFVSDPGGNVPAYDVSVDGTQFLMLRPETPASALSVVDHWQSAVFTDPQSEMEP